MKILLFGGTFDPPHIGHMDLLRNAIEAVLPDKVLVIPAGTPPHKRASATPAELRLQMCACFLPLFPGLEVEALEIRRRGRSYTVDTLREIGGRHPGSTLYLSIGGDMLLSFTAWHHYRELLHLATLVVQGRGEDAAALEKAAEGLLAEGGRILWAKGDTAPVSSSEIRAGLAAGRNMYPLIPPPADRIVREHKLYRQLPVACGKSATDGGAAEVISLEEARELVKRTLSEKRYKHVENVAKAAKSLALHYGADPYKAQLAAWLHDIVKECSREELLQLLRQDDIMAKAVLQRPLPVWHGPCAAIYAQEELDVQDEEILSAIACHTTGKVDMSLLDKVMFLADIISAERSFPGVGRLRELAYKDMDAAVVAAMEENIVHLNKLHKPLDKDTVAALAALKARRPDLA